MQMQWQIRDLSQQEIAYGGNMENEMRMLHDISPWLREKCEELWDIRNTRSDEIRGLNLHEARDYIRDNSWTRNDMLEYHMGSIYADTSCSISWALRVCTSKVAAIKHFVDAGLPTTLEQAQSDLRRIETMVNADGKDEMMWAYITQEYNFWNDMNDEEIYDI